MRVSRHMRPMLLSERLWNDDEAKRKDQLSWIKLKIDLI